MLDGYTVNVDDVVFDLFFGHGKVKRVDKYDGGFTVMFGKRETTYSANGYFGTFKRVYWDNPISLVPGKKDEAFVIATDVAADVYNRLKKNTWGLIEDQPDEETSTEAD